MKKIALILITFSGNCTAIAQKAAEISDSVIAEHNISKNVRPERKDSVQTKEKASIRLFPNPAKNKVEVEIARFEPGYVQVRMIDKNGILVRDDRRLVFSGNEIIVLMFSVKPGLYFLSLAQGDINLRSKLIVQ